MDKRAIVAALTLAAAVAVVTGTQAQRAGQPAAAAAGGTMLVLETVKGTWRSSSSTRTRPSRSNTS